MYTHAALSYFTQKLIVVHACFFMLYKSVVYACIFMLYKGAVLIVVYASIFLLYLNGDTIHRCKGLLDRLKPAPHLDMPRPQHIEEA